MKTYSQRERTRELAENDFFNPFTEDRCETKKDRFNISRIWNENIK